MRVCPGRKRLHSSCHSRVTAQFSTLLPSPWLPLRTGHFSTIKRALSVHTERHPIPGRFAASRDVHDTSQGADITGNEWRRHRPVCGSRRGHSLRQSGLVSSEVWRVEAGMGADVWSVFPGAFGAAAGPVSPAKRSSAYLSVFGHAPGVGLRGYVGQGTTNCRIHFSLLSICVRNWFSTLFYLQLKRSIQHFLCI